MTMDDRTGSKNSDRFGFWYVVRIFDPRFVGPDNVPDQIKSRTNNTDHGPDQSTNGPVVHAHESQIEISKNWMSFQVIWSRS